MRKPESTKNAAALAALVALGLPACGGDGNAKKAEVQAFGAATTVPAAATVSPDAGVNVNAAAAATAVVAVANATFKTTAVYATPPIDLIILRSRRAHDDYIVRQRIDTTLPILAARLQNASPDINVLVLDNFWKNDPNQAPQGADTRPVPLTPILGATKPEAPFLSTSLGAGPFSDALAERVSAAGQRQGVWKPLLVSSLAYDQMMKKEPSDPLAGFLRENSRLALLFLDFDESQDPLEVDDLARKFGSRPGGFTASTLAPTETGCTYNDNPVYKTNPDGDVQRNATIKLAQRTSGAVGSLCDRSYALFFDAIADNGLGLKWFTVTLPTPAKPDGIKKIMVNDQTEIKEFRYWPGTTTLELPTTIPVNAAISIEYVSAVAVDPVVGATNADPNVPKDGEKVASPAELEFIEKVLPSLNARCASCHNGRPFNTSGKTVFAAAQTFKAEILDRIRRDKTAAGVMPQGGWPDGADADKAKLVEYFSK